MSVIADRLYCWDCGVSVVSWSGEVCSPCSTLTQQQIDANNVAAERAHVEDRRAGHVVEVEEYHRQRTWGQW